MNDQVVMDPRISKFLRKHHVLTLCTSIEGQAWVSHAFYVVSSTGDLVFTSAPQTRHIYEGEINPRVAVSVVLESRIVGRLQGIQITGILHQGDESDKKAYIKRFPYAAASLEPMWRVEILTAKLTDNTLGFGKKLHYKKEL
ncbi:MAG: pyridoxamine 5'-phosphate oxidase family protein [Rikenellaceae bacterium]